ncbi:MAG: hypothetical protein OXL96_13960 [Candidatus Poribacteria bacterium]|nr:hypothetical protein [Candidatus Poribacteria bacterium]
MPDEMVEDSKIYLTCDECLEVFGVEISIALADLALKEDQGIPIVCQFCRFPQTPYEDD